MRIEKRGRSCKQTSSQFEMKKLQIRVDSVDCLWYSMNNSSENEVVVWPLGCIGTGPGFRPAPAAFVECGENEVPVRKKPSFPLHFLKGTGILQLLIIC